MQKYIDLVDSALRECVKIKDNPQKKIYEAMGYSLFAGGKRLRPVIMMMTAKMLGKEPEIVLPFACAIEMIHTYSLIHDDLPAMDNDDLRRGKPTNHKVYGEATAILAGDALLTLAFETAISCDFEGVCKKSVIRAAAELAKAAGADGMIGGQIVDIDSHDEDEELLKYLHSLKTGALIRASGVIGAILSGAEGKQIDAIDGFCKNLGIAFQIQDDILDVEGNEADLGKPIGSDAENNKSTYVTLFGIEKARSLSEEYTRKAIHCLDIFENSGELCALAEKLIRRKA
ncbi:MAG: polyprenyl synthetase family protein [Clostridiales bacterium]|nr:polyprenyl synthetase family protein [Clostridiales bacterium]